MIALHPSVRFPLYILGALGVLLGGAVLLLMAVDGTMTTGLLLRGLASLVIGLASLWLARRAREQPPAAG